MKTPGERHSEFLRVISCTHCTPAIDRNLLRDNERNVPHPGYIGPRYNESGVLLVGRNPAMPDDRLAEAEHQYTAALHALRDAPTQRYHKLIDFLLNDFIPRTRTYRHFPLEEICLSLQDIAFCNIVRCRTNNNPPNESLTERCVNKHFVRWLDLLEPRVVVFIGKWALDHGKKLVDSKGIPCDFINCRRNLTNAEVRENKAQVGAFVKRHLVSRSIGHHEA